LTLSFKLYIIFTYVTNTYTPDVYMCLSRHAQKVTYSTHIRKKKSVCVCHVYEYYRHKTHIHTVTKHTTRTESDT